MAKIAGRSARATSKASSSDNRSEARQTRANTRADNNKQHKTQTTSGDESNPGSLPSIHDIPSTRRIPSSELEPADAKNALQVHDGRDEDDFQGSDSSSMSDEVDYAAMLKDMIKGIGILDDSAGNIIELVTITGIQECMALLRDESSELRTDLADFLEVFRSAYRKFTDAQLIGLDAFRTIVSSQRRPYLEATMICIKANLAIFVLGLCGYDKDLERVEVVEILDYLLTGVFPNNFIAHGIDVPPMAIYKDKVFARLTEDLGVAIATQYFMQEFRENEDDADFDHKACLDAIFLLQNAQDERFKDLSLKNLTPTSSRYFKNSMSERYSSILQLLEDAPDTLQEEFVADDLWEVATNWVIVYTKALDARIAACDGVKAIVKLLKEHVIEPGFPPTSELSPGPAELSRTQTGTPQKQRAALTSSQGESIRTPFRALVQDDEETSYEHDSLITYPATTYKSSMPNTIPETPRTDRAGSAELSEPDEIAYLQPLEEDADNFLTNEEEDAEQSEDLAHLAEADVYVDPSVMSDIVPTQETANVLQIAGRTNKENEPPTRKGLLDSQAGAHRVTFPDDDEDDDQPAPRQPARSSNMRRPRNNTDEAPSSSNSLGIQKAPPSGQRPREISVHSSQRESRPTATPEESSSNANKRREPSKDTSDTDDDEEDFSTQDKRAAKRPRPAYAQSNVHRPRPRDANSMFYPETYTPETEAEPAPRTQAQAMAGRPRASAPSSPAPAVRAPAREPAPSSSAQEDPTPTQRWEEARAAAPGTLATSKVFTQVTQGYIPAPPQQRRQWSAAETRRLIELMDTHGLSWSHLKKMDLLMDEPLLMNRSQVQCKDKARNMKIDFLKSMQPMPDCFAGVTVGKRILEELRAKGVPVPEQAEERGS